MPERDRADEGLRRSQAQLKAFVRHAPMIVAMFDRNMNYELHPDIPDWWKDVHRQALEGATLKNDDDFWVQADGSKHWLRWAVLPWLDDEGAIGGIIISAEEITDRKRAEERLRESEQRYSATFAASPFAIMLSEMPEGRIVDVNEAFLSLFEYTREEVLGKTTVDLRICDSESQALVRSELEARGTTRDFECALFTRSGARRIVLLNLDWVNIGEARHLLTTVRDITERKNVEETTRLYEESKELDRLKSQFFANVSHELRTPLALMLGPLQKVLASGSLYSTVRTDLEVVERNARTLLGHVDDLLDVARFEAGRLRPHYAQTDVATLVRFVSDHFSASAKDRAVSFTMEVPDAVRAEIDPEKFQRVVFNLLSNAFKFTPSGGLVRVSVREAPGRFTIEVADSGPGIPEAKRGDVFERFHRLVDEGTAGTPGTGLGLSIVREFAALLRASVSIEEAPEGGALFVVDFPSVAPAGSPVTRDESGPLSSAPSQLRHTRDRVVSEPHRGSKNGDGNVLVVEDNPDMSGFIADSLEEDGFSVAVAFDGKQGYRMAVEGRPDLVLTDIMMPVMSGDELLRALRKGAEFDTTPIIVLTARADEELRVRLLREGAQDYLTKPFLVEELRTRVRNLVGRKRAEEQSNRLRGQVERLREEWASIIAHDLQQPINSIVLRTDLLLRGVVTGEQRRDMQQIRNSAMRLSRMARDLMDASRLESRHMSLTLERLDIGELVRDVVERHPGAAGRTRVRAPTDRRLFVRGDAERLEQVLANILSNAMKYGDVDAGIQIDVEEVSGQAEVSVANRGAGIPGEELDFLFERYTRTRGAKTSAAKGAGLGLYIAKGLVEAHGGRIWAESVPGEVTKFTFSVALDGPPIQVRARHAP